MPIKCCRVAIRIALEDDDIRTLAREPYMLSTGQMCTLRLKRASALSGLKNGASVVQQTG